MTEPADWLRYVALSSPFWESRAHRLEYLVRSRAQRKELARAGPGRTVRVGQKELPLDLSYMRDFLTFRLLSRGDGYAYEPGTTRVLLDALTSGTTFVDVGANIGYFTLVALNRLGAGSRILSIEPNPSTFARLATTVRRNDGAGIVSLLNLALSDADGTAILYHSPVEDARDSLQPIGPAGVRVDARRLDSLDLGDAPLVMKVDAEGAEERILLGAEQSMHRAQDLRVALEWNPPYAGPSLWRFLVGRFRIFRITEGRGGGLSRVDSYSTIRHTLTNLWLERR